jgi:hypothetical protein
MRALQGRSREVVADMTNTSAAASVSFVALSRIAGDHGATGTGSAMRGTGLSPASSWSATTAPTAGTNAVRRARNAADHNYIDVPATKNVAALAKQGAPPRGEPR